jgi:hypothetical protein
MDQLKNMNGAISNNFELVKMLKKELNTERTAIWETIGRHNEFQNEVNDMVDRRLNHLIEGLEKYFLPVLEDLTARIGRIEKRAKRGTARN